MWREGFPDRAYDDRGRLVDRSEPGAVLAETHAIVGNALGLAGSVDSLCLHGDTPGAVGHARRRHGRLSRTPDGPFAGSDSLSTGRGFRHVENTGICGREPAVLWSKLWDQKNVELSSTNPLRGAERRA